MGGAGVTEPWDSDDTDLRDRAVHAASGRAAFDLLICGATIADVATGSLYQADIGVCGSLIASVHSPDTRSDAQDILSAKGLVAAPGLIDSHMHVESSMITPETYAATILPRGVTTIVWDPHEFGNVAGVDGVAYALDSAERSSLRILPLAPSCVPSAPGYETAGADFTADVLGELLARDGIVGLAEVMDMAAVTSRAPRMRAILTEGLRSGKLVCGHARSLTGAALQAYVAAGVTSDHEIVSGEDLINKIRAGLTIELRGSHPYLLPEFARVLQSLPLMPSTVTLCSDDVFPDDLLAQGGVDDMLRKMVGNGLDPMRALQAATLNAAHRLNRRDLGQVAPGKRADIVLFDDISALNAMHVFRNGRPVTAPTTEPKVPPTFLKTCDLDVLDKQDFEIAAKGPRAKVAVIAKPRFTEWAEVIADVQDGRIVAPAGTTRIAVVSRYAGPKVKPRVGLLRGWGDWQGAFATTVSHDCHNLTVFGRETGDMADAANAVIEAGGGMAVACRGKITLLPLPVAGLVSSAPLATVAHSFANLRAAMDDVVQWEPPYLTFKALVGATLACNAGPHQTDLGIADPLSGILRASPVIEDGPSGG
jgi:adenine deaminase